MSDPKTPAEELQQRQKEIQGRNVAHYQVLLTAWIQTRMEHDKTLVAISSAGLGLLITVAAVHGVRNEFEFSAFIAGLIAFTLCIVTSLRIYQLNARLIEKELLSPSDAHPSLKPYDSVALGSFILAVSCFSAIGIAAIIHKYADYKESTMSTSDRKTMVDTTPTLKKSLDGLQQFRPEGVQQPVSQSPAPAASQPSTPQPQQSNTTSEQK